MHLASLHFYFFAGRESAISLVKSDCKPFQKLKFVQSHTNCLSIIKNCKILHEHNFLNMHVNKITQKSQLSYKHINFKFMFSPTFSARIIWDSLIASLLIYCFPHLYNSIGHRSISACKVLFRNWTKIFEAIYNIKE